MKKSYENEHLDSTKVEDQVEQHGENMRKNENKVSHEFKTKGDKVLALMKLEEGYDQKQKKKQKGGQKWRK